MIDLGQFLNYFKYKKVKKNRKIAQKLFLDLNSMTVTIHGRLILSKVCNDPDNDLPDEIRHMYWVLLQEAPIEYYALLN